MVQGGTVKISWLNSSFWDLAHDATDNIIVQHTHIDINWKCIEARHIRQTSSFDVSICYWLTLIMYQTLVGGQLCWCVYIVQLITILNIIKKISEGACYYYNARHEIE